MELTKDNVQEVAEKLFGKRVDYVYDLGDTFEIEIQNYGYDDGGVFELTFDKLETLSKTFNTKNINLKYRHEEQDWSDVTPGAASEFSIIIGA
jgi:hypothetical protein